MTIEQKTSLPPVSEAWKGFYSASGVRLLESAVKHAKESGRDTLLTTDITLVLLQEETIRSILEKVHLDPNRVGRLLACDLEFGLRQFNFPHFGTRFIDTFLPDILTKAGNESKEAGASKTRAGDIMMAIYNFTGPDGKALREALSSGKEKGVSFPTELRSVINQVEAPWTA